MQAQIAKWGNSLAIRLPKALAVEAMLSDGKEVEIHVEDGRLVIESKPPHFHLSDLLKKITPENKHEFIDSGSPVGAEVW
jgi:antitoxin MazE